MKREEIIGPLDHITEKLKEKEVLRMDFSGKKSDIGIWCPVCENKLTSTLGGKIVKWCPFCGQRIEVR